jgi:hypothetical protein
VGDKPSPFDVIIFSRTFAVSIFIFYSFFLCVFVFDTIPFRSFIRVFCLSQCLSTRILSLTQKTPELPQSDSGSGSGDAGGS